MKSSLPRFTRGAALCAALLACSAGFAQAAERGTTAEGRAYVSGGVSEEEGSAMQAERRNFSLWLVTAAKKSGAYLSGVQVTITDAQQRVVFDAPLDGPWLMIDLPLGRYVVQARYDGQTQQRVTTIHAGDHHEAFLYFDADADADTGAGTSAMPPARLPAQGRPPMQPRER